MNSPSGAYDELCTRNGGCSAVLASHVSPAASQNHTRHMYIRFCLLFLYSPNTRFSFLFFFYRLLTFGYYFFSFFQRIYKALLVDPYAYR